MLLIPGSDKLFLRLVIIKIIALDFSVTFFPSIWSYHLPQNMHRSFPTSESQDTNIFKAHGVGWFHKYNHIYSQ